MTKKLVQRRRFKGAREFELTDDAVYVRIKTALKEEKLTVGLTTLDPDPVVNGPCLEFKSRATGRPMLSLFVDSPTAEEFNAFVDALRQQMTGDGVDSDSGSAGLAGNSYEEPPAFAEPGQDRLGHIREFADAGKIAEAVAMLEKYGVAEEVKPFIDALEALGREPKNEACMVQALQAFDDLGIRQGAVLTYAPYISILLAGKPY